MLIMPNNFSRLSEKPEPERYQIQNAILVDRNNQRINLDQLKGKIVLFDVWSSSCLICIQKFPDLQKLVDKYRNDTLVRFIALNMPLKRDNGIKPEKHTNKYTFEKMFFATEEEAKKLSITSVPLVLIFDKDLKCRYAGGLNFGWNIFLGNVENIINQLIIAAGSNK